MLPNLKTYEFPLLNLSEVFFIFADLAFLAIIESISSSDLKSRPTLIRGHFCLHEVVRKTLHCTCATVGKKLLRRNLVYPAFNVNILRFKQVTIAQDKAAYCVFTQFRERENAIKFISVRTKTQ